MEIGVLDGENARTMIDATTQNIPQEEVEYYGFDFFTGTRLHHVEETLKEAGCQFQLFKGDTLHTLPQAAKTLPDMDVIFIDGGKSYTEAKNDWTHSKTLMHNGTAVFVHNYEFSGVRRMIDGINRNEYRVEILHPPYDYTSAMIKKKNYYFSVKGEIIHQHNQPRLRVDRVLFKSE